jgi:hypothetical protein
VLGTLEGESEDGVIGGHWPDVQVHVVVRVLSLAERINRNRYPGTCGGQSSVIREEDKEEQISIHVAAKVLSSG